MIDTPGAYGAESADDALSRIDALGQTKGIYLQGIQAAAPGPTVATAVRQRWALRTLSSVAAVHPTAARRHLPLARARWGPAWPRRGAAFLPEHALKVLSGASAQIRTQHEQR